MARCFVFLLAALAPAAPAAPPDPLDARAAVPPVVHRSTFAGLRSAASAPASADWKAANDTVARIGGWRAYAREAAAPPAAASAAASAPAAHRH